MTRAAERFFRDSDYWRHWSEVPDVTVDLGYALRAVRPSDRSILDVPCGRGRLLAACAGRAPGARLFGVDVSREMAAEAARRAPDARIQIASVYELPYRDRAFDTVDLAIRDLGIRHTSVTLTTEGSQVLHNDGQNGQLVGQAGGPPR